MKKEDAIKDLASNDDAKVIEAARYLGKEEEKDAIDPLIAVLGNPARSSRAKIAAADALGMIEQKGKSTDALRKVVETEKDNAVVYAALLAILNIKDFENPDARKALDSAEANRQNDPFIMDIVKRIRLVIKKD